MRRLMLALAGATALTATSAANAAITIGASGTTAPAVQTILPPDNVGIPQTVAFSTTSDTGGAFTSGFDFMNSQSGFYNFSVTTSTLNGIITLEQLLSGGGSIVVQSVAGSGASLQLLTGTLLPNTTYRFAYSATLPTGGGTFGGNASFYAAAAVPEPATWALMLLGFGGMGMVLRRRRRPMLSQVA